MSDYRKAAAHATRKVIKPVAKVHLASNLKWADFEEAARKAFVAAAIQQARENGDQPNDSEIATLIGWLRAEVRRVRSLSDEDAPGEPDSGARAQRVLDGWWSDADFHGAGVPLELPKRGPIPSVVSLVKRYASTDQRPEAILRELLRAGAVRRLDDGRYKVLRKTCINVPGDPRGLTRLANDVSLQLRAGVENIEHPELEPHCMGTVSVENLDPEHARILMARFEEDVRVLSESIRRTLNHERYKVAPGKEGVAIHLAIQALKLSTRGKLLRRGKIEQTKRKRKELKSADDSARRGGRS